MSKLDDFSRDRHDDFDDDDVYPDHSEGLFTLENIRALFWRQRYILIGVTTLALILGLVLTMLMTPRYAATSLVRVDYNENDIVAGQDLTSSYISGAEANRYLETQAAEIRSRNLAFDVIDDLGLASSDVLLGNAGEDNETAAAEDRLAARRMAASNILLGNLTVEVPLDSRIITIRYSSEDAELAAAIANSYAESFVQHDLERALDAYSYAAEYLEEQIADTRDALRDAEIRANEYARANAILGQSVDSVTRSPLGGPETLAGSNLEEINRRYNEARASFISARERWETVSAVPALELAEVQANPVVQQLRGRIAELDARLADLLERYQDDHPDVREVRAERGVLAENLSQVAAEIKASIRNEFVLARREATALRAELDQSSGDALDEQDRSVQYNLLAREAGAYRTQLESLLERYNEIASAQNLRSSGVTLLDAATVPSAPYSPNLLRNMLMALVLGGGLAAGLALLREILDDRLRSVADIERCLGVPALGQTPFVPDGEILDALEDPFSAISEAYSSVRATLDFTLPDADRKVVQFTSSQPYEGKTTSAIAVAGRYASLGKKVLLVDADLRRQSIARRLAGTSPNLGLVSVLFDHADLNSVLLPNQIPNLDVLPTGKSPPNPVEILSSGLLNEFLVRQREVYDVILLDGPPVMGLADAPLVSRFADCTVFVAEANRVDFGKTRRAVRRLKDAGARIAGAIVTKYRALEAGDNYSYQYNYYTYSRD